MVEHRANRKTFNRTRPVNLPTGNSSIEAQFNARIFYRSWGKFAPLIALSFLTTSAFGKSGATTPIARAPQVEQQELEARASALGAPTLAEWLEQNRPLKANSTKIQESLRQAQHAWLNESLDSARDLFRQITLQLLEDDWRDSERSVILFAHLRLAQSSTNEAEKQDWLDRAARAFSDLSPNADLFPPPLLGEFKKAVERATRDSIEVSLDAIFPLHRFVLINGRRFDLKTKSSARLPNGSLRVSAFSDSVVPVSEKLTTAQLMNFRPSLTPLFSGSCAHPILSKSRVIDIDALKVLYEGSCMRQRTGNEWMALRPEDMRLQSGGSAGENLKSISGTSLSASFDPNTFTAEARSPRRTWFWVAAASLAAGSTFLWYQRNQRENESIPIQPVHRTGF